MCEAAERALKKEREEGIEEGMEKGMEKGVKATKMILAGKSDEEIMKSTGLTIEQLEKLKKELEED